MSHKRQEQIKRWTIKPVGIVDDVSLYANEPLSIRADSKWQAEMTFLRMARNVLHVKPQLLVKNGAFVFVYHDGVDYCAEAGTLDDTVNTVVMPYDTMAEALKDPSFEYFASEEYQVKHRAEIAARPPVQVAPALPALPAAPAMPATPTHADEVKEDEALALIMEAQAELEMDHIMAQVEAEERERSHLPR